MHRRGGKRALLIDADLRSRSLTEEHWLPKVDAVSPRFFKSAPLRSPILPLCREQVFHLLAQPLDRITPAAAADVVELLRQMQGDAR